MEEKMGANTAQRKTQRNFLDISSAAFEAGYSPRHFRRIIEEDRIPVLQIGRKFFILSRDLEAWIVEEHRRGATVIGICGGYQMLGEGISDPQHVESPRDEIAGLGLLPISTELSPGKITRVVSARTEANCRFTAYEIHMGETKSSRPGMPPFAILDDGTRDGMRAGRVIGTYLHGAFEVPAILAEFGIAGRSERARSHDLLAGWFAPYTEQFASFFL